MPEAASIGRLVLLELVERLARQVRAIYQEKHALRTRELDQAVNAANRCIGFAAAHRHLDEGAWFVQSKRLLQFGNGLELTITQHGA